MEIFRSINDGDVAKNIINLPGFGNIIRHANKAKFEEGKGAIESRKLLAHQYCIFCSNRT
ncbi:hypothetical protein [Desulfocastanea catecholica]